MNTYALRWGKSPEMDVVYVTYDVCMSLLRLHDRMLSGERAREGMYEQSYFLCKI